MSKRHLGIPNSPNLETVVQLMIELDLDPLNRPLAMLLMQFVRATLYQETPPLHHYSRRNRQKSPVVIPLPPRESTDSPVSRLRNISPRAQRANGPQTRSKRTVTFSHPQPSTFETQRYDGAESQPTRHSHIRGWMSTWSTLDPERMIISSFNYSSSLFLQSILIQDKASLQDKVTVRGELTILFCSSRTLRFSEEQFFFNSLAYYIVVS